jgi:hypothetical protein
LEPQRPVGGNLGRVIAARRLRLCLPVLALALLVAGCGATRHRARSSRATRPPSSTPYRWLVRTTGSQPTIAQENREPGTRAWRLAGPAADVGGLRRGDVFGYVSEEALSPGQTERIYVSAAGSPTVRITIYRIGWYGGAGGRQVLVSKPLPVVAQPGCIHRFATGLTECHWHPTLTFSVPAALPSGTYIAKLAARSGQSDCLFVVLPSRAQPLLAQLPTATYEAYNAWGGDNLYPGGSDRVGISHSTQGIDVSYERPYDSVTGAGQFFARDVAMVWFLERYGYPVSYTTSESVDEDPGQLLGHRALIDFGHSEYWSERQADGFAAALNAGTSLLFLSSDTMAWRVRYADDTLIAYKEYARRDPVRTDRTGRFPGGGAWLTGSAYVGCITPRLRVHGPPTYRYYAWEPGPSLDPRWLFAGTGITPRTRIRGIVGYELDARTRASPARTHLVGSGAALCMSSEPGEPIPGPGEGLAQTTIYAAPSGAIVFNSGTLGWELGLEPVPSASPGAPRKPNHRLVALTRNLLDHVLAIPAAGGAGPGLSLPAGGR